MRKFNLNIYKIVTIVLIFVITFSCIRVLAAPQLNNDVIEAEVNEPVYDNNMVYYKAKANLIPSIDPIQLLAVSVEPVAYSQSSYKFEETVEVVEEENIDTDVVETEVSEIIEVIEKEPIAKVHIYSEYEIYELAKIIMCEAEGESQKCKEYIGQVILNRVASKKFPDTIHDVIFQKDGGIAQFSPIVDGRWNSVEPTQECYDAAYAVINASESLTNALYFEACKGDSWHSRNLTKVAQIDSTKFYI